MYIMDFILNHIKLLYIGDFNHIICNFILVDVYTIQYFNYNHAYVHWTFFCIAIFLISKKLISLKTNKQSVIATEVQLKVSK